MTEKKGTALRRRWGQRIAKRQQDLLQFHTSGNTVVDTYRIEKKTEAQADRYNILFSITETIKPSLYSQTPKPMVQRRQRDRNNLSVLGATLIQEAAITYTMDEQDFDDIIRSALEDFLLPGMGQVWLRYQPTINQIAQQDDDENDIIGEDGKVVTTDEVVYEQVVMEYTHWKDFLWGKAPKWAKVPWVARRVYVDRLSSVQLLGKEITRKLKFSHSTQGVANDNMDIDADTCAIWEIWDKKTRKVLWLADCYEDDMLKVVPDFLKLAEFYPCPEPMRAVTTNNKFTPRPFYSQYQAQAEELNEITYRIRILVDALRVIGIYDSSVTALKNLLGGKGNKMVPVDGWATVQEKGGLKGVVDFLPLETVINTLMQLYDARERVKTEIYEITGWSDIIRGVSKASETLGAQQIKAEWAGARLKDLQKTVQRFCRNTLRIAGEIIAEHFTPEMLLLMSGIEDDIQANPQLAQAFQKSVELLHNEKERCALIDIETDSTLVPDEASDKKERMEFVSGVGAFLQQAVPAMQQTPAMGPVLGEILMFAIRGFRSARTLESTFQSFVQQMTSNPPQQPGKEGGDNSAGAIASAEAKKADTAVKGQLGQAQIQQDAKEHTDNLQLEMAKEQNRHAEKLQELRIRAAELGIKEQDSNAKAFEAQQSRIQDSIEKAHDRQHEEEARAAESEDRAADRAAANRGADNA